MRLDAIARKVLPAKARQLIGCTALGIACRRQGWLQFYLKAVHGYYSESLRVVGDHTEFRYRDTVIRSPRDGAGSFLEVFSDQVYDTLLSPRENDVAIDIGAYVGMWSVRSAYAVGQKGHVYAIEPVPGNLEWLKGNVAELPVTVIPALVSDRDGEEEFYLARATSCSSLVLKHNANPKRVPAFRLDTLLKAHGIERVDFIKMDVEGAEMKVLQGAIKTLEQNDVRLSIASYHKLPSGTPEAPAIAEFLEGLGFTVYTDSGLRRYTYAEKTQRRNA